MFHSSGETPRRCRPRAGTEHAAARTQWCASSPSHGISMTASACCRLLGCLLLTAATAQGAAAFQTTLSRVDLDAAAFAEWVDGYLAALGPGRVQEGPAEVVCATDSKPGM